LDTVGRAIGRLSRFVVNPDGVELNVVPDLFPALSYRKNLKFLLTGDIYVISHKYQTTSGQKS
jgi:hypothetical protein